MGRRRRTTKQKDSVISIKSEANSSVLSVASTVASPDLNASNTAAWYTDKEEQCDSITVKLNMKRTRLIESLELELEKQLLRLPKALLNSEIKYDDMSVMEAICGTSLADFNSASKPSEDKPRRRRSRSVVECEFVKPEVPREGTKRRTRVRSTSVDVYQTPKNRVRLSTLTSAKKYTVSKPKKTEESGINMRRIMRPDEEAISTSGSPLYVHSGVTSTPHVNIPLPGGVVLNIEPKRPRGRLDVPELDEHTKKQIKILCQQLESIVDS